MMGGMGMARVVASPGVVAAGTVSLRVANQAAQTHELLVLPLPAGQAASARAVGANGQVDEAGTARRHAPAARAAGTASPRARWAG
jgi:hypothetical protein